MAGTPRTPEYYTERSAAHGDRDGNDAEIRCLRDLFEAAYSLLPPAQREAFARDDSVKRIVRTAPRTAA